MKMKFTGLKLPEMLEGNGNLTFLGKYVDVELTQLNDYWWMSPDGKLIWIDKKNNFLCLSERDNNGNQVTIKMHDDLYEFIKNGYLPIK